MAEETEAVSAPSADIRTQAGLARMLAITRKARTDFATFFEHIWSHDPKLKLQPFHHEAIDVITDPKERFVYWEAARGHLKCACAGQRVSLADGTHPAIETLTGQSVRLLSFDPVTWTFCYKNAIVTANGQQRVSNARLRSGRTLERTSNEPILTDRGWVDAGALQPGMYVAAVAEDPGPEHPNSLSEDEAWLLGLLIGDGCLHRSATLSIGSSEIARHAKIVATRLTWTLRKRRHKFGFGLRGKPSSDRQLKPTAWLRLHGLIGKTSYTKRVPAAIFGASKETVAAFLAGYWDADGTYSQTSGQLSYSSVSRDLLSDVQSLLLRIGCVSTLCQVDTTYKNAPYTFFSLYLATVSARQFVEVVPVVSKKGARAKRALRRSSSQTGLGQLVPPSWREYAMRGKDFFRRRALRFEYWPNGNNRKIVRKAAKILQLAGYADEGRNLSRRKQDFKVPPAARLAPTAVGHLLRLADEKLWWDEVVATTAATEETWAVTVADTHVYVCEDTISHNSGLVTAFGAWTLGRDVDNERVKILSANDKEARKRLFEIKTQIETNPLLRHCFPRLLRPKNGEWNKSRIILDRNVSHKDPSLEASGILSGSLGSRSTLILLDDVTDMRSAILQPQLREHVRQKLFGEVVPLLEPEGRMIGVGTPWTLMDVNAIMKEKFKLIGPHRVGTESDKFQPLWPYKFPREELKRMHDDILGPAEYARAYLCQALTGDTVPIQAQWIQYYDARLLGNPFDHFCLNVYDLAIEPTKSSDFFAFVTILFDRKRNFAFVADAWARRLSFRQQATAVVENAATWHPQEVVIESGGYQGALSSYLSEESPRPLPIWPFRNKGRSKERRLVEASPWFEQGRVFFHPKFDPRRNPEIVRTAPVISQLLAFPFDRHDDLVDAVVMGLLTLNDAIPSESTQTPDANDGPIRMTVI